MKNKNVFVAVLFCTAAPLLAQTDQAPLTERERTLLARIEQLEKRMAALEAKQTPAAEAPHSSVLGTTATGAAATAPPQGPAAEAAAKSPILSFASGTTLNFYFDGYY